MTYYYLTHDNNNGKNLGNIFKPILYFIRMQIQLDILSKKPIVHTIRSSKSRS
jgi:hypothetical protein